MVNCRIKVDGDSFGRISHKSDNLIVLKRQSIESVVVSPAELDGGWGRRYIGGALDAVSNLIRGLSSFNI